MNPRFGLLCLFFSVRPVQISVPSFLFGEISLSVTPNCRLEDLDLLFPGSTLVRSIVRGNPHPRTTTRDSTFTSTDRLLPHVPVPVESSFYRNVTRKRLSGNSFLFSFPSCGGEDSIITLALLPSALYSLSRETGIHACRRTANSRRRGRAGRRCTARLYPRPPGGDARRRKSGP